jgi:hypothetical protein
MHRHVADTVMHWVNILRVDSDNRFIHAALTRVLSVSPKQLKVTSAGTLIYAALLLTEGKVIGKLGAAEKLKCCYESQPDGLAPPVQDD